MTEPEIIDLTRAMLWVSFIISVPILTVALITGLAIGLFQALTSVQEMTLTFVPKIIAIFVGLIASVPFMFSTLSRLSDSAFDMIVTGGL